jgi:hypothetical protein
MRRTNFASFLYWKESGANSESTCDFSGAAAVCCADGALLMVVTGKHSMVPGTLEFPSGFVDVADFDHDTLNFDRHVEREVMEEFGVTKAQLGTPKSYLVAAADGVVQVISTFSSAISGSEFTRSWANRKLSVQLQSEIAAVVALYKTSDLSDFSMQPHVRIAAQHLLCRRRPRS